MSSKYAGSLFNFNAHIPQKNPNTCNCHTEELIEIQAELLMKKYGSACLNVTQLCEVLNVGQSNVYELLKRPALPVLVIGRRKVVSVVALAVYLVSGESSQTSS